MTTQQLKSNILAANEAYRNGNPFMTDAQFDSMMEEYKQQAGEAEYQAVRSMIHDPVYADKVMLPCVMGSLEKLKSSEPAKVEKWIAEHVVEELHISAKVDGISCLLGYANKTLVFASTRGNGYEGQNILDKVKEVKGVCTDILRDGIFFVRGELVIKKQDFDQISSLFANPRNAVAGIFNKKDVDQNLLSLVSFVAYEYIDPRVPARKSEQFDILQATGFEISWYMLIPLNSKGGITKTLVYLANQDLEYEADGLVLSDADYVREEKYIPDGQIAFKTNTLAKISTVEAVIWQDPSKDGILTPVAIVKPIQLGGSTISRVTLNNLDWIADIGIGIGSEVEILKAGDIIPKISKIFDNSNAAPIMLPKKCPVCGADLVETGKHLVCPNAGCESRLLERMMIFLRNAGIRGVDKKTIGKLGIKTMVDLVDFRPGQSKTETSFAEELQNKVFNGALTAEDVFVKLSWKDLAETTLRKIVDGVGFETMEECLFTNDFSALHAARSRLQGVGEKTIECFASQLIEHFDEMRALITSVRFTPKDIIVDATPAVLNTTPGSWRMPMPKVAFTDDPTTFPDLADFCVRNSDTVTTMREALEKVYSPVRGSICFTGALKSMTRSEAAALARQAGFEVKTSVSRGLMYLVTNDPNSGSGKNQKALQYGVQVIDEHEFLTMISM